MDDNKQNKTPEELNKDYFSALMATRANMGTLYISWAGLIIAAILMLFTWNIAKYGYKMEPLQHVVNQLMILVIVFMSVCLMMVSFRFLRNYLSKHQGFVGIWLTIFSIILAGELMFMGYLLTQLEKPNEVWYDSEFSLIVFSIIGLAYVGALIYNFYWLKKQLKIGFSEKRTVANYSARSKVYESKSLWIIFGFSMLGAFLSGNLVKVFGLVFSIFIGIIFSRLTIEFAYAAYLLNTNEEYWGNYTDTPRKPLSKLWQNRSKKISTYVILGGVLIIAITQIEDKYDVPEHVHVIFSYIVLIILIGFGAAFVMWIVKEMQNKNAGGEKE